MHRIYLVFGLCGLLFTCTTNRVGGQQDEKDELAEHRRAGLNGGDPCVARPYSNRTSGLQEVPCLQGRRASRGARPGGHRRQVWARATGPVGAGTERHDPPRLRHDRRDDDGWQGVHGRTAQTDRRGTSVARRGGQTRATATRRDRPGAADGHVIDARRTAQDIEGRAVRGPDRLSRDVEATGRRVAVRGHAGRDPGGRETDPARAAARGRDAVRPSGLDHRDPGSQGRVPRRRTEGAKDLARSKRADPGTGRNCSPTSATRRRPANSRAWSASRSIRGSSRTASTT